MHCYVVGRKSEERSSIKTLFFPKITLSMCLLRTYKIMPSVTLLWLISLWTMQENRCYFTQVFFGMYSYHILASTIFWNSCNPGLLFNFFSLFLRQVFRIIPAPNDQLSYSFIPNNFTKLWFTFLFFTSIRKDI